MKGHCVHSSLALFKQVSEVPVLRNVQFCFQCLFPKIVIDDDMRSREIHLWDDRYAELGGYVLLDILLHLLLRRIWGTCPLHWNYC